MGQNRKAERGGKGQNREKMDGEMRKLKRTEINRIRIRHQQEVESDYPYAGKRVPQLFVRYLCGSCPVLVRSFIEQLSNNYRTTIEQLSNNYRTSVGQVWDKYGKKKGKREGNIQRSPAVFPQGKDGEKGTSKGERTTWNEGTMRN